MFTTRVTSTSSLPLPPSSELSPPLLLILSLEPELRYITRLDIIPRWFALCVEMVCVQCEGCVRRCGVSALCVRCVVYSLQQYTVEHVSKIMNCFCYVSVICVCLSGYICSYSLQQSRTRALGERESDVHSTPKCLICANLRWNNQRMLF